MTVLLLTHRLPFAPNRGDRIRAYHLLKELTSAFDVALVSLVHDPEEERRAGEMGWVGPVFPVRVPAYRNLIRAAVALPGTRPLTHLLHDSPLLRTVLAQAVEQTRPDVVLAYCSGMARLALEPPLAHIPFVLDMVDVDSRKWAALADTSRWPLRAVFRREARCLAAFERRVVAAAKATLVVNERERSELATLIADGSTHPASGAAELARDAARVAVVPNGIDSATFARPRHVSREPAVVFTGVMNYAPNEQAALWLAREVWPKVRRARPAARLWLVGSSPGRRVRHLHDDTAGIEVTGEVPDVRTYLWRSSVAAAPLHLARGVQNKVLEAEAAGLPCVVTSAVWKGLPAEARAACVVADSSDEFAAALVRLLDTPEDERDRLVAGASLHQLQWSACLGPLKDILRQAMAPE